PISDGIRHWAYGDQYARSARGAVWGEISVRPYPEIPRRTSQRKIGRGKQIPQATWYCPLDRTGYWILFRGDRMVRDLQRQLLHRALPDNLRNWLLVYRLDVPAAGKI